MMPGMRRLAILLVAAAALLAPASAVALDRTVSVKATVEREVPNDTAEVRFSVTKERPGRSAALRIVAIRLQAVIAAVKAIPGVGPGDVSTGAISVRRVERGKKPVYRASEGVTVILHRPDLAGELVAAGVTAGATGTRGPNFFVGDREAAYDAALVEAVKRAKAKAEALAAAAGAALGPVISIAENGDVVSMETAAPKKGADSAPPVDPGKSAVTATVSAVFELR